MSESKFKNSRGYIEVIKPDHPSARFGKVHEHILVMEDYIRRAIPEGCVVHHRNQIRTDNRIENLLLMRSHSDHSSIHVAIDANNHAIVKAFEDWSLQFMADLRAGVEVEIALKKGIQETRPKPQSAKKNVVLRKRER